MWIECKCFWQREHSGKSKSPSWWKKGEADSTVLTLPPYTACTWCYEAMYKDEVSSSVSGKTYDNDKRQKNAEAYFAQFEEENRLYFIMPDTAIHFRKRKKIHMSSLVYQESGR